MGPEVKIFRSKEQVAKESRELHKEYWETHPLSLKGIADDLGELVYTASGGKLGKPSILSRASAAFAELSEINSAELHSELAKDAHPPEKKARSQNLLP